MDAVLLRTLLVPEGSRLRSGDYEGVVFRTSLGKTFVPAGRTRQLREKKIHAPGNARLRLLSLILLTSIALRDSLNHGRARATSHGDHGARVGAAAADGALQQGGSGVSSAGQLETRAIVRPTSISGDCERSVNIGSTRFKRTPRRRRTFSTTSSTRSASWTW